MEARKHLESNFPPADHGKSEDLSSDNKEKTVPSDVNEKQDGNTKAFR